MTVVHRHPDLTCVRWLLPVEPASYRRAEAVVNECCVPALSAARAAVSVESAYVSKHLDQESVWLTLFASLGDSASLVNAAAPPLVALRSQPQLISDPAREELLQSHCDGFRAALDLVTQVALDIHSDQGLRGHQEALVDIGVRSRTDRAILEPYLAERSSTYNDLDDQEAFWSVVRCNCLTGQTTDAIHWLYNIVLGFDWQWELGKEAIIARLGL